MQPYWQESFGHFLGRFRRANYLSSEQLSALLGQRSYVVAYWETPSRRRQPTPNELRALSQLTGTKVASTKSDAIAISHSATLADAAVCLLL